MCICYRSVYSLEGKSLGLASEMRPFITSSFTFGLLGPGSTLKLTGQVLRIQPGTMRRRRWRLLLG